MEETPVRIFQFSLEKPMITITGKDLEYALSFVTLVRR